MHTFRAARHLPSWGSGRRRLVTITTWPFPCAGVPKNDGSADPSEPIRFNPRLQFGGGPYMRRYLHGDAINMAQIVGTYGIKLTTVNKYARNVMAQAATP